MIRGKRCEVCGTRHYTKNKTCSKKCAGALQQEKTILWWKLNKHKVFHKRTLACDKHIC